MNRKLLIRLIAAVVAIALVTVGIYMVRTQTSVDPDYPAGSASIEVLVSIPFGAAGSDIAQLLVEKEVVKSFGAFFRLAVVDARSSTVAPGMHRLQTHIPAREALNQLLDPKRIPDLIRITEGAWAEEIFSQMVKRGFAKADLTRALSQLIRPAGISGNEGIFFPAQYSFAVKTTAISALQRMVDRFTAEAKASSLLTGNSEFSPMQLLTIASLIQAEGENKDFGKISRVVRNRTKIGMPLQFDTTVQYITRTRGQVFLSTAATRRESPYNTYLHYGLPPGPIGNPGRAAIDAALNPLPGDWLYFITVKPGDTRFTKSHDQFLAWKSDYQKNLQDGAFGKSP